jgi:hypothetical protein
MYPDKEIIIAVASSSVIAGIVAGVVSLRTNARNIKVANVTRERAKWRNTVRGRALEIHKAMVEGKDMAEIRSQLALILNPLDREDRAILRLIDKPPTQELREATLKEFVERVSLLLKHDWERAKWESSSVFSRKPRCPKRLKFEDFKRKQRMERK